MVSNPSLTVIWKQNTQKSVASRRSDFLFLVEVTNFRVFCFLLFNTFPNLWQNLDSSKRKEFADDNFKFDEIGGKFSNRVENTVGKGEIARYKQFLLFPQCFQKTYTADT